MDAVLGQGFSQSTNDSETHDAGSQLELHSDDSVGSDAERDDLTDSQDISDDNPDWNQLFQDNASEFVPQTHAVNSELNLAHASTPLQIFEKFFNEEIVNTICEESHRYANQKSFKNWTPFSTSEFWRFIAVNLTMGLVKKPALRDYWSTNNIIHTPFFSSTMSRDRYMTILRSLHFVDNSKVAANNTDRFIKLGTFMDTLLGNFRKAVHPGEYLCLDESLVPWKGRLSFRQYNPMKRARFGVKLFVLVDCSTKMILDILPYQGKTTKLKDRNLVKTLGFGGAAVSTMLEPYLGRGHRVVVDNWFNSPKLATQLKHKKTYILGTVQKRRKGMPSGGRMIRKLKKGEVEVFSDGDILVERWMDRREVCMLNTFMDHTMIETETENPNNQRLKPGSVLLYNSKMGAVDDADKVTKPYECTRKTYKWYRKVAFHFIDLTVYNSFLLFCQLRNKKMPYKSFVEELVAEILERYPKPASTGTRGRPALVRDNDRFVGQHLPEQVMKSNGQVSKSDCVYCRIVLKERKSSSFRCSKCKKRLCIRGSPSCYQLYHTQPTFKKVSNTTRQIDIDHESIFEYSEDMGY